MVFKNYETYKNSLTAVKVTGMDFLSYMPDFIPTLIHNITSFTDNGKADNVKYSHCEENLHVLRQPAYKDLDSSIQLYPPS